MHREPEWDDSSRGRVMRLAEYETSLCHCGCGQTMEASRDPKANFIVHEDIDYARIAIEKVKTTKRKEAEKRADKGEGWDDGLTLYVEHVTAERAEQMQQDQARTLSRRRVASGD